jgi:peptidyl-prolyl cis-trans isomerase SurA
MKPLSLLFMISCAVSLKAQTLIDRIVAVVDKEIITESELNDRLTFYALQNRLDATQPGLKPQILESMISEKLVLAQAVIDSVVISDDEVARAMDQRITSLVRQMGSEALVEHRYGKPISRIRREYRDDIRKQLLAQRVQQSHEGSLSISHREAEEFFETYRDSLPQVPDEFELSHLFVVPKADSQVEVQTRAKLKSILDSVKAGRSFAEFAKRYSVDGTAANGGELPFTKRGELVHDFEVVAFGLKQEGEISDIVKTPFGLHIMQLIERRGESVRVRHILLRIEKTAEDDSTCVRQLRELKRRAQAGESFGELAKKYSEDDETKSIGGELGKLTADQLTPEFSSTVRLLPSGSISEPERLTLGSSYGYHIVWLRRKTPAHTMSLATDYPRVEQLALYVKRNKQNTEWLAELRKTIFVENRLTPN